MRNESQRKYVNRSYRRSYDTDGSGIRNTTTGFSIQTPPQQQSQQQHKS